MSDGVDDRGCRARDSSEVVREGEDRPISVDRTELGVLSIVEYAIVDELRADNDVLSRLVRRSEDLQRWRMLDGQR